MVADILSYIIGEVKDQGIDFNLPVYEYNLVPKASDILTWKWFEIEAYIIQDACKVQYVSYSIGNINIILIVIL